MFQLPLLTQPAPDTGERYLLPIRFGDQPWNFVLASTYDGLALRDGDSCRVGLEQPPGGCVNSSVTWCDPKRGDVGPDGAYLKRKAYQRIVSLAVSIFEPRCATGSMALQPVGANPVATILDFDALRPIHGVGADQGLGPVDVLPSFWGVSGAAGILGVGSQASSKPWSVLLGQLGADAFTLDLNPTGMPSAIIAGNSARTSRDGIQWSSQRAPTAFQSFDVYDPSVCGAQLLGAAETPIWPGLIDTTSSCLALPTPAFDALFSWVAAANCSEAPGSSGSRRCYLRSGAQPSTLPVLSFRLTQHAPQLQLPLETLLLSDGSGELCVRERSYVVTSPGAPPLDGGFSTTPYILFGTKALQGFRIHVDMGGSQHRVGLEPRNPPLTFEDQVARRAASCASRPTCVGQQRYVAANNECAQPSCSFFYQVLDADAGQCAWDPTFQVWFAIVLGGFAIAELLLQQLQISIPEKFDRAAANGQVSEPAYEAAIDLGDASQEARA